MNKTIAIQVSPETQGAYFAEALKVAETELALCLPETNIQLRSHGLLNFFEVTVDQRVLPEIMRLSFVQGIFEVHGEGLIPMDVAPSFALHPDFVFGSKFKGKTNERLTQLLFSVGLSQLAGRTGIKVLDPMCGRATTLLWAVRYGLTARGIEIDTDAIGDVQRTVKKWSKIHRQKHQMRDGFIGKANKKGLGKYIDFAAEGADFRMVQGDGSQPTTLFKKEKFDLILSDLPYGVQHFASQTDRNPLGLIEACVNGWYDCLKQHGVVVIAYNKNNPKRPQVEACFEAAGFTLVECDLAHRMSESIVRDIIIAKR